MVRLLISAHPSLLEPDIRATGAIVCRERLGGMLRYYHREAA